MYKSIFTAALLLIMQTILFGQSEEATTKGGKKVILYSNGTWKYADENKSEIKDIKKNNEEKKKGPEKEKKPGPEMMDISSDCAAWLETIEDKRTGIRTTRTKNMIIVAEAGGKKEIGILIEKGPKEVISVILRPVGAGECIGEGNKINIVFTDGSRLDLANDGLTNCRGESTVNFGSLYGRKKSLEDLKTKKIRSIRTWTQQGSVQQNLSDENQEQFLQMINCLYKQ